VGGTCSKMARRTARVTARRPPRPRACSASGRTGCTSIGDTHVNSIVLRSNHWHYIAHHSQAEGNPCWAGTAARGRPGPPPAIPGPTSRAGRRKCSFRSALARWRLVIHLSCLRPHRAHLLAPSGTLERALGGSTKMLPHPPPFDTFWFCYEMTHPRYFGPNIEPAPWGLIAETTVYR